jgi:hypothetical protein
MSQNFLIFFIHMFDLGHKQCTALYVTKVYLTREFSGNFNCNLWKPKQLSLCEWRFLWHEAHTMYTYAYTYREHGNCAKYKNIYRLCAIYMLEFHYNDMSIMWKSGIWFYVPVVCFVSLSKPTEKHAEMRAKIENICKDSVGCTPNVKRCLYFLRKEWPCCKKICVSGLYCSRPPIPFWAVQQITDRKLFWTNITIENRE